MKSYKMSQNVENQRLNYPTHQYIKIRNTINIPVVVVVVVVVIVVIGRCRFQQFFSQSYNDGQLSLLCSTSRLPVLSEHVLSSVTENQ